MHLPSGRPATRRAADRSAPETARPDGGGQWSEIVRTALEHPDDPFWHNDTDPCGNETPGTGPAPLQRLLNRGLFPVGGGTAAVNATGWDAKAGCAVDWVPSTRMVVDLSDVDRSSLVSLTAASGHAFNVDYADQQELWRDGRTAPWPFSRSAVDAAVRDRLTLVPGQ
ncbi:MAG: penicillin acylase family protein [Umezawaea sp.]